VTPAEAIPRHVRRGRFPLVVALLCATTLSPRVASADVTLSLSSEGHAGAWLACPLHDETVEPSAIRPALGGPLSDALRWIKWSLIDGGTGSLDLNRAFGERRSKRILLGAVLTLKESLDGLLLLSVDGTAKLLVDGVPAWVRTASLSRGKAWDPIPLALSPGEHVVVLDLGRNGPTWNVDLRVLSRADLAPPAFAGWRLPGASEKDATRLAARLARVEPALGLVPSGYQPRVRIVFPRGAPSDPSIELAASLTRGNTPGDAVDLGTIPVEPRGVEAAERLLASLPTAEVGTGKAAPNGVAVRIGAAEKRIPAWFDPEAPAAYERALSVLRALQARKVHSSDPDVAVATLERMVVELGARLDAGDPSARTVRKRLSDFVASYEAGKDPLRSPAVLDLARRSSLDGSPQPLELHVPASYKPDGTTRYPLVVLLHGYDGTPERIMTAFLGTDSKRPYPGIDGFILAPAAHGNAFYRGPGETDAMEAIDWVLGHYPIDPDRISIAGHSMGGTGATELAFRYPDRFSAISSLAGYHSYFVRRDVQGRPLRAWEWAESFRFSPASWAENGRDIPLYVAQGTDDKPLAHSEVLVDRYRTLGFSVVAEWPEIGHDVWRIAWSGAKQWPTLSTRRASRNPKRVTLTTDSLATAKRAWAELVELERPGYPGALDAKIVAPDQIAVTVTSATAVRLARPEPLVPPGAPVTMTVNGAQLQFGGADRLEAHHDGKGWVRGLRPSAPGVSKRAGLEGPIRDAFRGPLAFVYGTLDTRQARAAREVAEHFRARYSGDARFPLVADVALSKELASSHSLFVVGSAESNGVLKSLDSALPIGIARGGMRLGGRVIAGDAELGTIFVYPNPKNPARYVVAVEASDARGLYRAMSLPLQLPDFVVFDSKVASAAGQQILGDAQVLAAGYFDRTWALPHDVADVIAVPPGRDAARWRPN
jgi:predicted esterase